MLVRLGERLRARRHGAKWSDRELPVRLHAGEHVDSVVIVATPPAITRPAPAPTPEAIAKAAGEESMVRAIVAALLAPLAMLGASLAELLARRDPDPSEGIDWSALRRRLLRAVSGPLATEAEQGARSVADRIGVSFDLVPERAVAIAEAHAGELVDAITATARDAVRQIIARGMREGRSVDAVAAEVRSVIGLHPRWANAVANRRRALESMKNPPAPARIDRLVAQYRERLLTHQARTIARTELMRASNLGTLEGHRQALAAGTYPNGIVREWVTAPETKRSGAADNRTCAVCRPMNGRRVEGVDTPFVTSLGPVLSPPAHPACRCRTILIPKGQAA